MLSWSFSDGQVVPVYVFPLRRMQSKMTKGMQPLSLSQGLRVQVAKGRFLGDTWDPTSPLPIGPEVVPFYGLYLESHKVIPKKELLRGLWV